MLQFVSTYIAIVIGNCRGMGMNTEAPIVEFRVQGLGVATQNLPAVPRHLSKTFIRNNSGRHDCGPSPGPLIMFVTI